MTKKYVLHYYNLETDDKICFESEDPIQVENEAIRRSMSDNGKYTYRMETWENGKMIGEWRFFQNGREFTMDIIRSVVN